MGWKNKPNRFSKLVIPSTARNLGRPKIFTLPRFLAALGMTVWGILVLPGCYSFTGASIPSHIKTVALPLPDDQSSFGQSEIRQDLNTFMIDKFTREGSLHVAERSNGDALLETTINRITDEAVGVRAGEQLTNKRVTIYVDAIYKDQKKQKTFWTRSFQQSSDYPIADNLAGLKSALRQAEEKLAEELLLAAISNW